MPALIGAAIGVWAVTRIPNSCLTPLVMALLIAAAVAMIVQRPGAAELSPIHRSFFIAAAIAFFLAFYDGFFGPGTGTFLILAYTWLFHDPLDAASANAKVVNFASNLASMVAFGLSGAIVWKLAAPMAAGQLIGGYFGAHATIRGGRAVVRYAVIVVSLALVIRLGWRLF